MDFGMPSLTELKNLEACAALCKELGLRFIELNMNLPEYQADRIDAGVFAEVAERFGLYYTVHFDENLNPFDFNDLVADAYKETVLRTIDLAKRLRIPVLNMHLSKGVYFTLPDRKVFLFDEYSENYMSKVADFRDICQKAINGADIKICIENADGYWSLTHISKSTDLLIGSDAFALTFDTGHNAFSDGADEAFIQKRADKLFHMHLHDAVGHRSHLPLGTGALELTKYLHLADRHNCRVVLETKTVSGLSESVRWIRENGRQRYG